MFCKKKCIFSHWYNLSSPCIDGLCFSVRKCDCKSSFMCFSVFHSLHSCINFQVISWVVKIEVLFKVKEPSSETVKKLLHPSDYHRYSCTWKVIINWKTGHPLIWINKPVFILNTFLFLFILVQFWSNLTCFCTHFVSKVVPLSCCPSISFSKEKSNILSL